MKNTGKSFEDSEARQRQAMMERSWRNLLHDWRVDTILDSLGKQAARLRRSSKDSTRSGLGWHCMIMDLQQENCTRSATARKQASVPIPPRC